MSDFSATWLALRESADRRARADALVNRLQLDTANRIDVVDLGCGTGANLRHLAPLLAAAGIRDQNWTCADHDAALLQCLPERTDAWAADAGYQLMREGQRLRVDGDDWHCRVRTRRVDLSTDLPSLSWPIGGLVTASALLDLVSADWLDGLLGHCRAARCQLSFTLSYDGRCELEPAHADDGGLIDLVNRHQCTDKGFGPALGPAAAAAVETRCTALGYQVASATSDWRIGPDEPALQRALVDGWRHAALELHGQTEPERLRAARIDAWHAARVGFIDAATSRIRVGHRDMVATIPSLTGDTTQPARSPSTLIDPGSRSGSARMEWT